MKKVLTSFLLFALLNGIVDAQNSIDYVDLFIATSGGHGQLDPAACVPFGMVKWSPDTNSGTHSGV